MVGPREASQIELVPVRESAVPPFTFRPSNLDINDPLSSTSASLSQMLEMLYNCISAPPSQICLRCEYLEMIYREAEWAVVRVYEPRCLLCAQS
jgi:hypothetical protein